jgi:hypothetical protein
VVLDRTSGYKNRILFLLQGVTPPPKVELFRLPKDVMDNIRKYLLCYETSTTTSTKLFCRTCFKLSFSCKECDSGNKSHSFLFHWNDELCIWCIPHNQRIPLLGAVLLLGGETICDFYTPRFDRGPHHNIPCGFSFFFLMSRYMNSLVEVVVDVS